MGLTIEQVAGWAYKNLWRRGDDLRTHRLTVDGATTVNGSLSVAGDVGVSGDLSAGHLTVDGDAVIDGDIDLSGTLNANGIDLGDDLLDTYIVAPFPSAPVITGTTNPTVTYTAQAGRYCRLGMLVFYSARITIATISGGTGNLRLTLPVATINGFEHNPPGQIWTTGVALNAAGRNIVTVPVLGQAYAFVYQVITDANFSALQVSALAAGDVLQYGGFYFVGDFTLLRSKPLPAAGEI